MKSVRDKIPQPIRKFLKKARNRISGNAHEIQKLHAEIDSLKFQVEYFKHHFDISQMTPATGFLRNYQMEELQFAKQILEMFGKYDIRMFLEGGALLGARRHRGFIPWDDDIDLGVTRSDFNRLMDIGKKDFIWIDSSQKQGNYAKFYDDAIRSYPGKYVFIRTPYCLHIYHGNCLKDALNIEFFSNDFVREGVTEEEFMVYREKIIRFVHGGHSWKEIFEFYDEELKNNPIYSLEETSRITPGIGNWVLTEYPFHGFRNYEELYPLQEIPFENTSLPGPNNPDAMLNKQFGKNWRKFPKDVGIPHTLQHLNSYLKTIGTPIDYAEF